jgi:DNA-binding MarR family transcriptional regulator
MARLPLSALLGQVCVALTVEADNEFEHRLGTYFTTDFGAVRGAGGPWLTSAYCYINFLRLVPDDGIRAGDLAASCGDDRPAPRLFDGLRRWGYCTFTPDIRGTSPRAKDADSIVRCTPNGLQARAIWAETFDDLVTRWSARGLDPLRESLVPVVETIARPLPEYLPLVEAPHRRMTVPVHPTSRPPDELHLLSLIAQLLTAITLEFEERSPHSLATCASLLRGLTAEEVLVRDLPEVTGVAKKDWDAGVNQLARQGLVAVGRRTEKPSGKTIHLTDAGREVVADYSALIEDTERSWEAKSAAVRQELERVVDDALSWATPYPDNWRARRPIVTLPHQPIVSHRGGFPDGS